MCIIGVVSALTGLYVGRYRKTSNPFTAIFGFLLFVAAVLPYNIQGGELMSFSKLPLKTFED